MISGDWRQVLPVVPRGNRSKIVRSTIKSSPLWENVEVLSLTENMRVKIEKKKIKMMSDFINNSTNMKGGF